MRSTTFFSLFTSLLLTSTTTLATTLASPAVKDATIIRSVTGCPTCPGRDCYACTTGNESTIEASTGGHAWVRALVGFKIPTQANRETIEHCTVQFPAFTKLPEYGFNMTITPALDSTWDEATVDAYNAPDYEDVYTLAPVPALTNPPLLDITNACLDADEDGMFSIYLGVQEADSYEIYSKDSGDPAILRVHF